MTQNVDVTATMNDREMIAAFLRQQKEILKIQRGLQGTGKSGRRAGGQMQSGFARARGEALRMVGAIAGVGGVVGAVQAVTRQLRKEVENIRRRQREAADAQIETATAQKSAIENLPKNDQTLNVSQLNSEIKQISKERGVSQRDLFLAASTAFSSKGDLTARQALEAVEIAAEKSPESLEAIRAESKAILVLQQATGAKARDVAGFQIAAKQRSPVVENELFARNIAPGIANLLNFKNTPQEATALLATLGQGISDSEGRITRNAAISFAKQLEEDLADVGGSTLDKLEFLRSEAGAKQRKRLLGPLLRKAKDAKEAADASGGSVELTGEAKAFTTLVDLIQGSDTKASKLLEANLQAIPALGGASKVFDETLARVNAQELQQTAAIARRSGTIVEDIRLRDVAGARGHIVRERLKEILRASGASKLSQDLSVLGFEAESGFGEEFPLEVAIDKLRARERGLRTTTVSAGTGGPGNVVPNTDPEDLKQAAALDRAADTLEELLEVTKDRANDKPLVQKKPAAAALNRKR